MDEASAYTTGQSDLAENPSLKASESICEQNMKFFKTKKLIDLIMIFVFSYKYQFMDVYRTAS